MDISILNKLKSKGFRRIVVCAVATVALFGSAWLIKNFIESKIQRTHIPVAMALDDSYLYPTLVAVTSMMESAEKYTAYDFYIMHPSEFTDESKNKLESLTKKYSECTMKFIDMGDEYKNAYSKGHVKIPSYYRLSLSELLPDLQKILWIDGDTLTFRDLRQMYDVDMTGLYYRGYLDDQIERAKSFDIDDDHYICDGVMVVNLDELRKDDMVTKFKKFIEQKGDSLVQYDQTVINVVAYQKIGKLPPRFGMYNYYSNAEDARKYSDLLVAQDKYSADEMEEAFKNLSILHCVSKPWRSMNVPFAQSWWDYARKSDFYGEIHAKYPIFE